MAIDINKILDWRANGDGRFANYLRLNREAKKKNEKVEYI